MSNMLKIIALVILLFAISILYMFWHMTRVDKSIEKQIDKKYTREKYYNDKE